MFVDIRTALNRVNVSVECARTKFNIICCNKQVVLNSKYVNRLTIRFIHCYSLNEINISNFIELFVNHLNCSVESLLVLIHKIWHMSNVINLIYWYFIAIQNNRAFRNLSRILAFINRNSIRQVINWYCRMVNQIAKCFEWLIQVIDARFWKFSNCVSFTVVICSLDIKYTFIFLNILNRREYFLCMYIVIHWF